MKTNFKDKFLNVFIVSVFLAAAYLGVGYEMDLWKECRADHSWAYCVRVLGHHR